MKSLFLFLLALAPTAQAADSLMVSHVPNKATIIVNEQGQKKLAQIFRTFLTDPSREELCWSSNGDSTSDVILNCRHGRNTDPQFEPYSCTFRFSLSPNVTVQPKTMQAKLGDISGAPLLDLSFENAEHDTFHFQFFARGLAASSTKQ